RSKTSPDWPSALPRCPERRDRRRVRAQIAQACNPSTSARLHRPDEIGEPLARLVRVAALERLEPRDPVDAEIAEVCSPLAPGAYRPRAAPVVERERPDVGLARL